MTARMPDRGSASVLAVGVIGILVALTAGALVLAGAVRASHQARLGADLAAIAGAQLLRDGGSASQACSAAASMAMTNGGSLVACSVGAAEVSVTVSVRSTAWPAPATAKARAGPELPVREGPRSPASVTAPREAGEAR